MLDILEIHKKILSIAGVSGFERKRAETILNIVKPFCNDAYIDKFGNVIANKKGKGKKIMLSAYIDSIGFIATHIEDNGIIRFARLGDFNPYRIIGTSVRFENGKKGFLTIEKNHDSEKIGSEIKDSDMFIDIGARSAEEAKCFISIGDTAEYDGNAELLCGDTIVSPYCNGLIACAALICAMENIKSQDIENDIFFVFTVREEVGGCTAKDAAHHIKPDLSISIEVTYESDGESSIAGTPVIMGNGPTVRIKDVNAVYNHQAITILKDAADKEGITFQNEFASRMKLDCTPVQHACSGIISGLIGLPARYVQSPMEMVSLSDVRNCVKLICSLAVNQIII